MSVGILQKFYSTHGFWHQARRAIFPFVIALLGIRVIHGWIPIKPDTAVFAIAVQFVIFFQVGVHVSNAIYSIIGIYKLMCERTGKLHDLD